MYNLKISESSLCLLITIVGRHLFQVLNRCNTLHSMSLDDFNTINSDFLLLQYLLDVFKYDGTVEDYLQSLDIDNSSLDFLKFVMYR